MIRFLALTSIAVLAFWGSLWGAAAVVLPLIKDAVFQPLLKVPDFLVFLLFGVIGQVLIVVAQSLVIYKAARWLWAPIEAREMLRKNLCPHCRFSLAAIVPDPDGCTVCPECGAAWKLPELMPPNNPA
jgi:hypothetical protein